MVVLVSARPCDGLYKFEAERGFGHSVAAAPFDDAVWSLGTEEFPGGYVLRKWTGE